MAQDRLNCMHYWMINGQNVGTCTKCGVVRDFADIPNQKKHEIATRAAVGIRRAATIRRNEATHNS